MASVARHDPQHQEQEQKMIKQSPVEKVLGDGGAFASATGLAEAATQLGIADPERLRDWLVMFGLAVETESWHRVLLLVTESQGGGLLPTREFVEVLLAWTEVTHQQATVGAFTIGMANMADAMRDGKLTNGEVTP